MIAQPKHIDPLPDLPATETTAEMPPRGRTDREASGGAYAVGGQVGQMHAELAQRLAHAAPAPAGIAVHPAERVVRFLSVAGGFGALALAYAGVAYAIWH